MTGAAAGGAQHQATHGRLDALRAAGVLTPEEHRRALALASPLHGGAAWALFLRVTSLSLGAGLVIAGVVYFVAYNWAALGPFSKVLLVLAALSITTIAGVAWRPPALAGRLAHTASAVLVGVLLAVVVQAYPTGGEMWKLYVAWAALALPWVLAARFAPLWFLWLLLVNVALVSWWGDRLDQARPQRSFQLMTLSVAAFDAALLGLWLGIRQRRRWMAGQLVPRGLTVGVVAPLTLSLVLWILEDFSDEITALAIVSLAAYLVAGVALLRYREPRDLFGPAMVATGAVLLVSALSIQWTIIASDTETAGYLVTGLVLIVAAGVAAAWLRRLAERA